MEVRSKLVADGGVQIPGQTNGLLSSDASGNVSSKGGLSQGQVLAWNALINAYLIDDGVHSQYMARGIAAVNSITDPRATNPANFTALASPLGPPRAPWPVVTQVTTGGTLAAGVYLVELTYVTAAGETTASVAATITTTGATSVATIKSPPPVNGVTDYNVYMSQAGGSAFTKQNATPVAIGTDYVVSAPPTNTGAAPPGANTATAAGTISQTPTNRADGFRQMATPKSCVEIVGTPAAGGAIQLSSAQLTALPATNMTCAFRAAFNVTNVAGGGAWHVALVATYWSAAGAFQGSNYIWESPQFAAGITSSGWMTAEGWDNQFPNLNVGKVTLALFVFNDSGAPGAITLRATEWTLVVDPDGDVPPYIGGDMQPSLYTPLGLDYGTQYAWWTGTADASTSGMMVDPVGQYSRFGNGFDIGFNNFGTLQDYGSMHQSLELMREMGATISRENMVMTGGQASPYIAPAPSPSAVAWMQMLGQAGIKLVVSGGSPSWMWNTPGYNWPTDAPTQAQHAAAIVAALKQIGPQYILAFQCANEPNNAQFSGSTASSNNAASFAQFSNAIYDAIKADPATAGIKFCGGILSGGSTLGQTPSYMGAYLTALYTAGLKYDWLDIHPYPTQGKTTINGTTFWGASSGPNPSNYSPWAAGLLDQGASQAIKEVKDIMASHAAPGGSAPDTRPIFLSEFGQLAFNERAQGQTISLGTGMMIRDSRVVGICFNGLITRVATTPGNDWATVDPSNLRRRHAARMLARMHGLPPPPHREGDLAVYDATLPDSASNGMVGAVASVGALAANARTSSQIIMGYFGPSIKFGIPGGVVNRSVLLFMPQSGGSPTGSGLAVQPSVLDDATPVFQSRAFSTSNDAVVKTFSSTDHSFTERFYVRGDGLVDTSYLRVTGNTAIPASGAGAEVLYNAGVAWFTSFDRTGSAYKAALVTGSFTESLAQTTSNFLMNATSTAVNTVIKNAASQSVDSLQIQNSSGTPLLNIDFNGKITQYEYAFSAWKDIGPPVEGQTASGAATITDSILYPGGAGANSAFGTFYLDPADYGAGSRIVKLRMRVWMIVNSVAPGVNYTIALKPVTGIGGASGAAPTATVGAAVLTTTFTTPAASSQTHVELSPITFPAAGFYAITLSSSGAAAAGNLIQAGARMQVQQV